MSSRVSVCVFVCAPVLDVNDETPTFNPHVYNVSLKESVPRDHTVARLSCSDNDAGLNAELSYFITGQKSQWSRFCLFLTVACDFEYEVSMSSMPFVFLDGNQDGKFSVGFRDGVVRTVVGLDRETQASYRLIVEAIGVS